MPTEHDLFASIGEKQLALETALREKAVFLDIIAKLVSGELARSRVLVNLTSQEVTWAAAGERPGLPATFNGMPQCVVAPDESPAAETVTGLLKQMAVIDVNVACQPAHAKVFAPEFHRSAEGPLIFQRHENGDVEIFLEGKSLHRIDVGHWVSTVLNLTLFSERPNDWHQLMAHHQGVRDVLSPHGGEVRSDTKIWD